MPWTETRVMDERRMFIDAGLQRREPLSALCEDLGLAAKPGISGRNGSTQEVARPRERGRRTSRAGAMRPSPLTVQGDLVNGPSWELWGKRRGSDCAMNTRSIRLIRALWAVPFLLSLGCGNEKPKPPTDGDSPVAVSSRPRRRSPRREKGALFDRCRTESQAVSRRGRLCADAGASRGEPRESALRSA